MITVGLPADEKGLLDRIADERGMPIKEMLGRMLRWLDRLSATERCIVLDQLSRGDVADIVELLWNRRFQDRSDANMAAAAKKIDRLENEFCRRSDESQSAAHQPKPVRPA